MSCCRQLCGLGEDSYNTIFSGKDANIWEDAGAELHKFVTFVMSDSGYMQWEIIIFSLINLSK